MQKLETGECHPADEMILTVSDGYVRISELDPNQHLLVSYDKGQGIMRRGGQKRAGYPFENRVRSYSGSLVTITTDLSEIRVTSDHHLTVRWAESAIDAWIVYLMKKGNWWRVGQTQLLSRSGDGARSRLNESTGEALWVLGVFQTRREALFHEALWSARYGLPGLTWVSKYRSFQFSSEDISRFYESLDTATPAKGVLKDFGLDPSLPFRRYRNRQKVTSVRASSVVKAVNLLPGYMEVPVDTGHLKPTWLPFKVSHSFFEDNVYSLSVPRHHHYVDNHAVVHNCSPSLKTFAKLALTLNMTPKEVMTILNLEATQ